MAQKKGRKALVTAVAVLIVLLALIGTIAVIKAIAGKDSSTQTTSEEAADTSKKSTSEESTAPDDSENSTSNQTSSNTALDPATVATIDIPAMEITVSYVKGIGGFEYEILRASGGTRSVEFRNASLVGTKCTNDLGTFASILENPTTDELAIVSQKTTVEDTLYGLSLADATCTTNPELLAKYQKSFSDAFYLLKKM